MLYHFYMLYSYKAYMFLVAMVCVVILLYVQPPHLAAPVGTSTPKVYQNTTPQQLADVPTQAVDVESMPNNDNEQIPRAVSGRMETTHSQKVQVTDSPQGEYIKDDRSTDVTITMPSGITPFKLATTTVFWVGEGKSTDNGFIDNIASAWDVAWEAHYGGYDDPNDRCGYRPCSFTPKENPFYVALPYSDLTDDGEQKSSAQLMPWYDPELPDDESQLKNRWVEVRHNNTTCYGQVEDVGPFSTDDFAYVFGGVTTPQNTFGEKAGIDLSPAMRDCLIPPDDVFPVSWRFVMSEAVPVGPWLDMVTAR